MSKRRQTRSTGVSLEVVVIDYVKDLAEKQDRDRSFIINNIIREHAERSGVCLQTTPDPRRDASGKD